jgi:hypothetical protein
MEHDVPLIFFITTRARYFKLNKSSLLYHFKQMSTAIIDDSFSRDLLYLFDKKRSKIHYELGLTDVCVLFTPLI